MKGGKMYANHVKFGKNQIFARKGKRTETFE